MFPDEFYTYLANHTLIGIKGGMNRKTFLEIWMVEVDKRIFARSWNKSERSWFTAFLNYGEGEIKFGQKIIAVNGRKFDPDDELNKQISQAYLTKYNQPGNRKYAEGISKPEYFNYTMEFISKN